MDCLQRNKMDLNFKIICLETKNYTYLTSTELARMVHMSSKWNRGIYNKLHPFFKEQCYLTENGEKKDNPDGLRVRK